MKKKTFESNSKFLYGYRKKEIVATPIRGSGNVLPFLHFNILIFQIDDKKKNIAFLIAPYHPNTPRRWTCCNMFINTHMTSAANVLWAMTWRRTAPAPHFYWPKWITCDFFEDSFFKWHLGVFAYRLLWSNWQVSVVKLMSVVLLKQWRPRWVLMTRCNIFSG